MHKAGKMKVITLIAKFLTTFLIVFLLMIQAGTARQLVGQTDSQEIRLETKLVQGGEYVQASQLIEFFENNYLYDSLSGTLTLERRDGVRVGMKAGDQRIVVGTSISNTGMPPIRESGRLYIPFYIVDTFVFPKVRFKEGKITQKVPQTVSQETPTAIPTTPQHIFVYPTKPVQEAVETRKPIQSPFPTRYPRFQPTPRSTQPSSPQQDLLSAPSTIIVLDPAHDRENPGARGPTGLQESNLTFSICQKMAQELSNHYEVILTRHAGNQTKIDNEKRIGIANRQNGGLFVSIHCGALATDEISRGAVYFMNHLLDFQQRFKETNKNPGTLVLWNNAYTRHVNESLRLARSINKRLQEYYTISGIIKLDSNPRPGRLAILRGLTMPGVVIELGNMAHPETARQLGSEPVQSELAHRLAIAITDFLYERAGLDKENKIQ